MTTESYLMRTSDVQNLKESKNFTELLFGAQCIDKEQLDQSRARLHCRECREFFGLNGRVEHGKV